MFCVKCGREIPDDSVFCPECGNKCGGTKEKNKVTINFDFNQLLNYILSSLKNPISTMKNSYENVSKSVHIGIIAILTLLVPAIHIGALKSFVNSCAEDILKLASLFGRKPKLSLFTSKSDIREMARVQEYINEGINEIFPFVKLYMMDFFRTGLYYIIIIGLIFLVYKFIFKVEIDNYKFLGVLSVITILNFILVLVSGITVFLSFKISIVIKFISTILNVSLLLLGMREVTNTEDRLPYVVSISYGIGFMLTNYIYFNYLGSVIKDSILPLSIF